MNCNIKNYWNDLKSAPIQTISNWSEARFLWLVMAGVSLSLVIVAHSLFQNYLYMLPCEQCVYIRFAFFCMVFGGLIACINPKNTYLKIVAYILAFYGIIRGMMFSVKLNDIHHAAHGDDPFGVQGCSAVPTFDFNLPLHIWFPDWFNPTGDCGFDNPIVPDGVVLSSLQQVLVDFYSVGWYLIPSMKFMNMAQACFIAFFVCFILLSAMLTCWVIVKAKRAKNGATN